MQVKENAYANRTFPCFFNAMVSLQVDASELPCEVIRGNKAHNRIKLAFFAEGYTDAERIKYQNDVENMVVYTLCCITF
jgi:hypothetical protein